MSGDNLFDLFKDIFEGTRTFDAGIPINLEGYWSTRLYLPGTSAGTTANYNTFAICPYTQVDVQSVQVVYSGASTGACTIQIERIRDTEANGAGDDMLATAVDLNATANTVIQASLVTSTATQLVQNNRLGVVIASGAVAGTDDLVVEVLAKILQF